MSLTLMGTPSDEDVAVATSAFQLWQAGNQQPALDALRPQVEAERPWAVALTCWFMMQQGVPGLEQGLPLAKQAARMGMPWSAVHFFNNLIANIPNAPHLIDAAMELAIEAGPWWIGIDPVGQGWNLIAQGRPADGVRLMGLRAPFPSSVEQWTTLAGTAQAKLTEVEGILASTQTRRHEFESAVLDGVAAIEKEQQDLQTAAKQAGLLVSTVVSDSTAALFKEDAKRNEDESKKAWGWGLFVLAAAAIVAIAPLVLHYLGLGPKYSTAALLGSHAGSTAALATVAGVLLARARSRDLARQRANDLSTAMGTMIAYSNQIQDAGEKQRFMTTMGQLVLQAHLTVASPGHPGEESLTGLVALANLMRGPGGSTPPNG